MKLTTAQAGQRLGVTDRSVLNYINRGLLRAEKVVAGLDWHYEIDSKDLERFANSRDIPLRSLDQDNQD